MNTHSILRRLFPVRWGLGAAVALAWGLFAGLCAPVWAEATLGVPVEKSEGDSTWREVERPDLTAELQAKQPFTWFDGSAGWNLKEGMETKRHMHFPLGDKLRLTVVFAEDARGDQKKLLPGDTFTFEKVEEAEYTAGPRSGTWAYRLVPSSVKRKQDGEIVPIKFFILFGLPRRIESVSVLLCILQAWFEAEGPPATFAGSSGGRVTAEAPWKNTLGMEFVSAPETRVLMSRYETRVGDYQAYVEAVGDEETAKMIAPGFQQTANHPVVQVSWHDARRFCAWLTARENRGYRLPTDAEWSRAVGLGEEGGGTPEDKDGKVKGYPWGSQWPPPKGAGNFADAALKKAKPDWAVIDGYSDGYAFTSPVGQFRANALGLHDLSGNVWEWCEDKYKPSEAWRVLRGGSWFYDIRGGCLLSSYRLGGNPEFRFVYSGFRVVCEER